MSFLCEAFKFTLLGSGWVTERQGTFYGLIFEKVNKNVNVNVKEKKVLWAEMEMIPFTHFIHLDNHLDGARGTLWMRFIKDYSLPFQMKPFGQKKQISRIDLIKSTILPALLKKNHA